MATHACVFALPSLENNDVTLTYGTYRSNTTFATIVQDAQNIQQVVSLVLLGPGNEVIVCN